MQYSARSTAQGGFLLACVAALIAACSAPSVSPTASSSGSTTTPVPSSNEAIASPSMSLLPSPSADPILSALTATTARGTARVTLELLTAADGLERTLLGEGVVDFARSAGDLKWTGAAGQSREVRTEEGFFVEVESGQWLAVDPATSTPTSDAPAVLRGIADLRDPVQTGSEVVDGQSATRITGWLPAPGNAGGLGLTAPERAVVDASPQARLQVTIWIDESGRIVQVLRTLEQTDPVAATSLVQLSDFGVAAPISAPSSIAASAE